MVGLLGWPVIKDDNNSYGMKQAGVWTSFGMCVGSLFQIPFFCLVGARYFIPVQWTIDVKPI